MLVYGDRIERADPRQKLRDLAEACADLRGMRQGFHRHAKLVELLIESGKLLQGLADADFARAGADRRAPDADTLARFLVQLAREVMASWDAGFASELRLPDPPDLPSMPETVELREPEGYSFYALYPESYAEAARTVGARKPCVIGIRSIGTSLAAVVAPALGVDRFATVRPFGDPFARRISVSPELERELLEGEHDYVIVDEGPGRSGSSFGAVADWLFQRGVPLSRIAFITSHGRDPGDEASEGHKRLWRQVRRYTAEFDGSWLARRYGPLEPFCAGERMKFLGRRNGETVLLKFVGLADVGERKFQMAKALHATGWTAEPVALAHGFLVERWQENASPLARDDRPLRELPSYIGARARLFPANASEGASIGELLAMTRRNVELAMEYEVLASLWRWAEQQQGALAKRVARVRTDNRMDASKWLRLPDGRLLKTDALDHHCAHDLIGAQDFAWDVAGAAIEFDLDEPERAWLAAEAGREAGRLVDPELLEFMTLAYLAFRLGKSRFDGTPADAARYERRLRSLLGHSGLRSPQESALGSPAERTGAGTIQP